MKILNPLGFSFKSEPRWILAFGLAPAVIGFLILLFVAILKLLR